MSIQVIRQQPAYRSQVRLLVRGDSREEVLSHCEDWALEIGGAYSPSYSTPQLIEGKWESIATRYASCD